MSAAAVDATADSSTAIGAGDMYVRTCRRRPAVGRGRCTTASTARNRSLRVMTPGQQPAGVEDIHDVDVPCGERPAPRRRRADLRCSVAGTGSTNVEIGSCSSIACASGSRDHRLLLRRRSAWTSRCCSGTSALDSLVNTSVPSTVISESLRARTVALRGRCSSRAISPKKSPGPRTATRSSRSPAGGLADDFELSCLNGVEVLRRVALLEDAIAMTVERVRHAFGAVRPDAHQVARKEQLPGPVAGDLDAAPPRRHLHQIHRSPHPPGDEPGHAESTDLRDRIVAADRAQLPLRPVGKRPGRLAVDRANDVVGHLTALPLGKLPGRRTERAVQGIHDARTVADGPRPLHAAHAACRARSTRAPPSFAQPRRSINRCVVVPIVETTVCAEQPASIFEPDAVVGHRRRPRAEQDRDARLLHLSPSELAQLRAHFGEDLFAGVHQRDREVVDVDVRIEPPAAAHQIVQLAGHLDAAESAADHDEAERVTAEPPGRR